MVFHADYEQVFKKKRKCEIQVGDLVKIRDYDWLSRDVALVTEVRELIHDQSGQTYYAVTATLNGKEYTFSHRDFELVSKAERK
jgi:SHS2 domain-containing protein